MNFDSIIEEELGEARERIKSRVAMLLLGGAVPAPVVHKPPSLVGRPPRSHTDEKIQRYDTEADAAKVLEFVRENPGCKSREIAEFLGAKDCKAGDYMRPMAFLKQKEALILRGEKTAAAWWAAEGRRAPDVGSRKSRRLPASFNSVKVDHEARDKKILKFITGPTWRDNGKIKDHMGDPKWGTRNAVNLALHRLVQRGEALVKQVTKPNSKVPLNQYRANK